MEKKVGGKREQTQVRLAPKTHRKAKVEAAKRGISMKQLLVDAVEQYLALRVS